MMAAGKESAPLIERLPSVQGRISENVSLAALTWFRVGGPAEVLFRPADPHDLAAFIAAKPRELAVTVIGVASNLLIRDGGIAGVAVRLGRGFADIAVEDQDIVVGAGALDRNVALSAQQAGIDGLEFLSGIPGTIGGGLRMNAGAYGTEFKDVVIEVQAIDPAGALHRLTGAELGLSYRHCALPENWIFVGARLRGRAGDPTEIGTRMAKIEAARAASQPIRARTGGSTFANPTGHQAWELIDRAGCRGLVRGGAQVSEKHANFLINTGNATAADLEGLGEEVRRRVHARFGITLHWEIRRVGRALTTLEGVT
jgi:UDP-N-acetylmuramate dehydrogenase